MKWLRRFFRRKKKPRTTVICARVGESLAPPPGSVVALCARCGHDITVAPLTIKHLSGTDWDSVCIQCVAAEDPNLPLGPMSPAQIRQFMEARGGLPMQVFRTVGEMNEFMNHLFPGREP